jgi:hypothetical protein
MKAVAELTAKERSIIASTPAVVTPPVTTAPATASAFASTSASASTTAAETDTKADFTCPVCMIQFDSARALAEHENDLKPIRPIGTTYVCTECKPNRTFANLKARTQHMLLAHPTVPAPTVETATAPALSSASTSTLTK